MGHRRLERVETIIEWQKRMLPEGNNDGFFLNRQNCGFGISWPSRQVHNRATLSPFGHRLRIYAIALGQPYQALLTILYCSSLPPDPIRGIASVVVALPCKIWPIVHPSIQRKILHHQIAGLNT